MEKARTVTGHREVHVPRQRLRGWLTGFSARHGTAIAMLDPPALGPRQLDHQELVLAAPDGAVARVHVPFGPLPDSEDDLQANLIAHVLHDRLVGAILARKGGHAIGVFHGEQLICSKVGSSYVQGKTKAGGWSQQRYARRRDNQSRKAYADAAQVAVDLLLPQVGQLDALMTGGDKTALNAILADPRLNELSELRARSEVSTRPVADPRLRVLIAFPHQFLAVRVGLNSLA